MRPFIIMAWNWASSTFSCSFPKRLPDQVARLPFVPDFERAEPFEGNERTRHKC